MTLPRHFLARFVKPAGVRLEKRPDPVEVAGVCPKCKLAVLRKRLLSETQLQGIFKNGVYWHLMCQPLEPDPTYQLPGFTRVTPAIVEATLDKGNLRFEEYRFWVGYRAKPGDSKWAMCRCCRDFTYSSYDREAHFREPKRVVGGDQCSTRLVKAYNVLLETPNCIVCKQNRHNHQKWGVPICTSLRCQMEWMYDSDKRYIQLAGQLQLQLKKAEFMAREKAKGDEKANSRPYCEECNMFADNPVHAQLHSSDDMFVNCTSIDSVTGEEKHLTWCNKCRMYTNNINHGPVHNAMMRGGTFVGEA